MRPSRLSLATRLTAWYAVLSFVLVLGTTGYLYWSVSRALGRQARINLTERVHMIELLCKSEPFDLDRLRDRVERQWPATQIERAYTVVRAADGTVLATSPGAELAGEVVAADADFQSALLPGGGAHIHTVIDQSKETELLATYRSRILWALTGALVIGAYVGRGIARRGVRPIEEIGRVAARINSSRLHERLDPAGFPVEMASLTVTLNGMFERLEEAFRRLSQVTADIAHELKTPINNVAGEIEVALGKARTEDYYKTVCASTLEECARVSAIVDTLLFLARCENPDQEVMKEPLDLRGELANIVEFYEAAAADAQLAITLDAPQPVVAPVERTLFQRAIGNLLTNAIKQTPPGGTVEVRLRGGAGALVEIKDTGRGVAAEDLPYVFDRFYRADPSRSKDSGGAGLGLAIVKSIAEAHGGSVRMASAVGKGTTVSLELPLG